MYAREVASAGGPAGVTLARRRLKEVVMLHYALLFFVVAVVAALLGMRGVAGISAEIGYVLVTVAVIFLLVALFTGRTPLPPP